jgi:glyoxylase-like metal-dependent hydrolase (beta-lactamase superfamily II)
MVWMTVVATLLLVVPAPGRAQSPGDEWRVRFAAGEEARRAGDHDAYAREMSAAARALPAGQLNRPFVQYHAARGAALAGRTEEAVGWLRTAWEEGIESLMISFAPRDPAFVSVVDTPGFRGVMALAEELELEVRPLGGRAYLLTGAGSNVLAHVGPDGVLLVDTGYGAALPALRRALEGLGAAGVDLLLITHPHEDHMGAAGELGVASTILAHPGTAAAMREPYVFMEGVELPPKPPEALPDVEIAGDTTFVFNGETVRILPTVAHTTGDLSVYFAASRVAHLGDAYLAGNPMMFPGTADPAAFLDGLEAFVDGMDPATVVVGGHEEPADLAAVRAQIATSRACMAFVSDAFTRGLDLEATAEEGAERFPVPWIAFFYGYFAAQAG